MSVDLFLKLFTLFVVGGIGYGAARAGLTGGAAGLRTLSNIGFMVFLPGLLFRTTATVNLAALPWRLVAAFFGPLLLWALGVWAWQRWHRVPGTDDPAAPAIRAVTLSFGNTVQLGLPFAAALFGEEGLRLHVALVSLHALLLLGPFTVLAEADRARAAARHTGALAIGQTLLTIARQTLIHPVVLPVLLGLAWNLGGLALPQWLDSVLQMLGQGAVPLCLVLIGVSLDQYGLGPRWSAAAGLAALKLLLLPALVATSGVLVFHLDGVALSVLVMAAALPAGSNTLLFAQRYRVLEGEASAVIVLSTAGFALTAPLWLSALAWWRTVGW
ncbi:AEC family transporter [Sphaerotilus sp.]|uniref:AEC family transporter n=1 Tax=Sphaerotilus sp. TaxID=2093942 RepID=UPI00286DA651|nr:AEC family transporter [Sphaerotilus sp.]